LSIYFAVRRLFFNFNYIFAPQYELNNIPQMKNKLLTIALLAVWSFSFSQNGKTVWKSASRITDAVVLEDKRNFKNPNIFELDITLLKQKLANAPTRFGSNKSGVIVSFPDTAGSQQNFQIQEFSNMAPELAARYPEIKSYVGHSVTDPTSVIYISVSPLGLQTMMTKPGESPVFIEPYTQDLRTYSVFRKSDRDTSDSFECKLTHSAHDQVNQQGGHQARPNADDGKLRNFRLAVSVTGEYTAYFGGSKAAALAAINNTMTRVNAIFERDFGVHLEMISNMDAVIYTAAASDPYSAASAGTLSSNVGTDNGWNLQLQKTLTNVIGDANYDIGHLFGATGGGGNAGCIACVCRTPTSAQPLGKGSGFTSPSNGNPRGDAFDIDYVAHEMGHQFGASHTFTYSTEMSGSQMEPGSGSTIMGYAGIAGGNNVQTNSDAYFHAMSIQQVTYFVKSSSCQAAVNTNNATPTAGAGADYTIPKGTPFMLTGTATDVNDDALTYNWEQMDRGSSTLSRPNVTALSGPAFRSYGPTTNKTRYFPRLETIKTGATSWTWEALPTVARVLNFRFTVRDNKAGGGANNSDDTVITVNATAGPFSITSQNAAVSYQAGTTQTVTWNVAGTTGNGINAANVDILLSRDGGNTYPITLLAGTPNDGSQPVVIPNNPGTQNRIMVKGSNHIFFDINNVDFTITSGTVVPEAPSTPDLSASGTTATSTNLSWTPSMATAAITGYDVYQNGTLKTTVTGTSLAVTGLTASTATAFFVKAKDAVGNISAASNTVNVNTLAGLDTVAPSAPSALAASGTTTVNTTLSWNASTDNVAVVAYQIFQNGVFKTSITGRSFTITGLTAATTYTFTVKAIDAAGNLSAVSNTASVTTLPNAADTTIPTTPANLTATNTTQTETQLTWTAATDNVGVASYSVYQNGVYIASPTTTTYAVTGLTANTTYSFTVKAKDAAGNLSVTSNTATITTTNGVDTTPPTTPTSLAASNTTQNSTKLTWNASTDNVAVVTYSVYRSGTYIGAATTTNYTVSGLAAGTTYAFTVKGKDAAGNLSAASNTVNVTTLDTTVPSTPASLTATGTTESATTLNWTASTDNVRVTGYDVFRNGVLLATATTTTYTASGLNANTTYAFTVKAKDAAGNVSATSNSVSVTTLDTTAPTTPTNLTATGTTQSATALSWTASTDNVSVTSYDIFRNGTYLASANTNSYAATGLNAGTTYTFTVKAKDAAGNISASSNTVSVTTLTNNTDSSAPSTPTNLTAALTTQNSTALAWNASTDNVGVTGYDIFRNGVYLATANTNSYAVTGLNGSTSYSFNVKAKDAAGNVSATSNTVTINTLARNADVVSPTTPANLTASATTQTSTKLSWTASTDNVGVTSYSVYRNGSYLATATSTTYTVNNLAINTTYTFSIRAKDAAGNLSQESNILSVKTLAAGDNVAPTAPSGLVASMTTQVSTKLSWQPSTDNVGVATYDVFSNGTFVTSVTALTYKVNGLLPGTTYVFTVKGKDAASNSSAASNALNVTTIANEPEVESEPEVEEIVPVTITYCARQGNIASGERIGRVVFGTIDNASTGVASYENFTAISTDVRRSQNYAITITPVWRSTQYAEGYAVFIDYNNDGDFTDAGEKVVSKAASLATSQTATFTIPSSVVPGPKVMRVVMKRDGIPVACEAFTYGQVEDYTINIVSTSRGTEDLVEETVATIEKLDFQLYPNPVSGSELNISVTNDATYRILNLVGQEISKGNVENETVPVSNISEGIYLLEVTSNGQTAVKRFIRR